MVRALVLALAAASAGCASLRGGDDAPPLEAAVAPVATARIGPDTVLTLPLPPGYPEERTIVQTGRAQFGDRQASFESVLSLGPARTEIVLMMPIGPRLATIVWDETGIHEDRTILAPDSVPVENILADIFVSIWPVEAVTASLPEGVELSVDEAGVRRIHRGETPLVTVTPDAADAARTVVRNDSLGYEVAIVRQSVEP